MKAAEEKEKKDVDAEMAGWKEASGASPALTTRAQPSSYQSTLTTVLQQQNP